MSKINKHVSHKQLILPVEQKIVSASHQKKKKHPVKLKTEANYDVAIPKLSKSGKKILSKSMDLCSSESTVSTTTYDAGVPACVCSRGLLEWDLGKDAVKKCKCKQNIATHQRNSEEEKRLQQRTISNSSFNKETNIGDLNSPVAEFTTPLKVNKTAKKCDGDIIRYILSHNDDSMIPLINKLRIDIPLCTMPSKIVKTKHIDDFCGLEKVVTINMWTVSLLPNRQLRLENEDHCYHIRLSKMPSFKEKEVTAEGCLVPGGHLFRLEFALNISDKEKEEWLTIKDTRYIINEPVLDYMITHPFGSLVSVRSTVRITDVHDPNKIGIDLNMIKMFECFYYQRHLHYQAIDKDLVGHLKIGKWGSIGHLNALFFKAEGVPEDHTAYLMVMTLNVASFRELKATIYADMKDSESHLKLQKGFQRETSLKVDYLSVCCLLQVTGTMCMEKNQFHISKFVFDHTMREFSSVNFENKKVCFEAHRIIARSPTDKEDYDFRVTGRNIETQDTIDLKVRAVIPENYQAWIDALSIPLASVRTFLKITLCELSERDETLCDITANRNGNGTFEQLKQIFDMFPNIEEVESCISYLSSSEIESLVLLTLDALFFPLISLKEAKEITNKTSNLVEICSRERAEIMQYIHRHIRGLFIDTPKLLKHQSKIEIWHKLVPYYMRIGRMYEQYQSLISGVAEYFDEAPYSCPVLGPHDSTFSLLKA